MTDKQTDKVTALRLRIKDLEERIVELNSLPEEKRGELLTIIQKSLNQYRKELSTLENPA